jgi:hypothetical protein
VAPLAVLVRAKLGAALRQTGLAAQVPAIVWRQPWVVDCRPVGSGAAALKYLAPYIFRVALSNKRIVHLAHNQVTFRYVDGATHQPKTCMLSALAFLHRFLQHVLPRGFVKVRSYGLFSRRYRRLLGQLRAQLAQVAAASSSAVGGAIADSMPMVAARVRGAVDRCPQCGQVMQARPLAPPRSRGPPALRSMNGSRVASRPACWTRRLMRPWHALLCSREEAVRRWSACARDMVAWV